MEKWYVNLNPYIKAIIPTVLITIFILLPLFVLSSVHYKKMLLDEKRSEVTLEIQRFSSSLDMAINSKVLLLNGLEGFVDVNKEFITDENFLLFAEGLTESVGGIRNVIIAPGGINRHVYPIEGNESSIGHDLINDDRIDVKENVAEAIETGKIVINGPYELRQGGLGIVFRKAVFYNGDFWGLISEVLDVESVFEIAGLENYQSTLNITISSKDKFILGDKSLFDHNPITHYLQLPQGQFEIEVIPLEGWEKSIEFRKKMSLYFMCFIGVLIIVLIYSFYNRRSKLKYLVLKKTQQIEKANLQLITSN